jgi:hypothetical protein
MEFTTFDNISRHCLAGAICKVHTRDEKLSGTCVTIVDWARNIRFASPTEELVARYVERANRGDSPAKMVRGREADWPLSHNSVVFALTGDKQPLLLHDDEICDIPLVMRKVFSASVVSCQMEVSKAADAARALLKKAQDCGDDDIELQAATISVVADHIERSLDPGAQLVETPQGVGVLLTAAATLEKLQFDTMKLSSTLSARMLADMTWHLTWGWLKSTEFYLNFGLPKNADVVAKQQTTAIHNFDTLPLAMALLTATYKVRTLAIHASRHMDGLVMLTKNGSIS